MYSKDTMAMAIDTLGVPTMPKLLIYSQSNNAKIDCGNRVNANSISWGPNKPETKAISPSPGPTM